MSKRSSVLILGTILLAAFLVGASGQEHKKKIAQPEKVRKTEGAGESLSEVKEQGSPAGYVPVVKYDPSRNAEQDLADAIVEARRSGKRILVKVGGEWCVWCHIMDDFFAKNPDLLARSLNSFVPLKINFSEENPNAQVLSRFPAINGYPHIFILDKNGKLIRSQDTAGLEEGKTYNLKRFTSFLETWSPPANEDKTR